MIRADLPFGSASRTLRLSLTLAVVVAVLLWSGEAGAQITEDNLLNDGDRVPWRPIRAYDDGPKTYIDFDRDRVAASRARSSRGISPGRSRGSWG